MYRPTRSLGKRIALGCCFAACVVTIAAGVASAFCVVRYWASDSRGVILQWGDIRFIHVGDKWGKQSTLGLNSHAVHPRFKFRWPGIETPGRTTIVRVPLWLPLAAFSIPTFILWRRVRRVIPPGHCPRCGYDLTGNTSGVCSECGLPADMHMKSQVDDSAQIT